MSVPRRWTIGSFSLVRIFILTLLTASLSASVVAWQPQHDGALISDAQTGRMWLADPALIFGDGSPESLLLAGDNARSLIARMNQGLLENFGYTDWRLASRDEMAYLAWLNRSGQLLERHQQRLLAQWLSTDGTLEAGSRSKDHSSTLALLWPIRGASVAPDFGDVVLLATNSMKLNPRSAVLSGDMVVNNAASPPALEDVELSIGVDASTPAGFKVEANRIRVLPDGVLGGDAFFNTLENLGSVNGSQNSPLALPVFALLPPFENANPGNADVAVPKNGTVVLGAGDFRTVTVGDRGTLVLTGGVYNFQSLDAGKRTRVEFDAASSLRIADSLRLKDNSTLGPAAGSGMTAADLLIYVAGSGIAADIGKNNQFDANLHLDTGDLELGQSTLATGLFIARNIQLQNDAQVVLDSAFSNQPPVAVDDDFTMLEDGVLNGDLLIDNGNGADSDPDGDPLSINTIPVSDPANGNVTLNGDGSFSYTPDPDFNGNDSFEYELQDGNGGTDTATVFITVDPVNDAPSFTAGPDQQVVEGAGPQVVSAWATDIEAGPPDESAQNLTFLLTDIDASLFTVQPSVDAISGDLSYTPAANVGGSDTITIELMDDGGTADGGEDTSPVQTFVIEVQQGPDAVDDAAAANSSPGDAYHTALNTILSISDGPLDLLANDTLGTPDAVITHFGGGDLGGSVTDNAAGASVAVGSGSLQVNDDGSFSFTPDSNFTGLFSFSYRLSNAAGFDDALVSLAVGTRPAATNDARNATGNVQIDTSLAPAFSVLTNDTGDVIGVASMDAASANGGQIVHLGGGQFSYNPPPGFEGADTFSYSMGNGFGNVSGTVTVTVTDMIWFVDASTACPCDGRLTNPFNDLAVSGDSFDANAADDAGDNIFLADGNYNGGLTLLNQQRLIGDGSSGTLASTTGIVFAANSIAVPAFSGVDPVISSATNGINLAQMNTVRGLTVGNTSGIGINGPALGAVPLNILETTVSGNGALADLNNGVLAVTFDALASSASSTNALRVTSSTGSFSVLGATTIAGANGNGVTLQNNAGASFTFPGLAITNTGGSGLTAGSSGTLSVTGAGNSIDTTAGLGVDITGTVIGAAGITFQSVSANGAANGIILNNTGASGGFNITGDGGGTQNASGGTLTNLSGDAISLNNTRDITLNQMAISNIGRHGVFGLDVVNLTMNNSTFNNVGNANDENTFEFRVADNSNASAISGNLVLNNVDVSNFHDTGLLIFNESGTLNVDIDNSDFDDNDDTNGVNAIFIETEGNAAVTADINGGTFNDLEGDVLVFEGGGTGTQDVNLTGVVSTNGGGPDNFPNGGGVAIIATDGASVTFDIAGNVLTDQRGDPITIATNALSPGNLEGRIGGSNPADGNTISGSSLGDGIQFSLDGSGGGSTFTATILVQNNEIGVDTSGQGGPFNGLGDDGIQVLFRDNAGTLNLTIEDNTFANTVSEAIRIFSDEDTGIGGTNPSSNIRIVDNAFTNIDTDNNENEIELRTSDTADACYHVVGNDNGSGGSPGTINLSIAGSSTASITQASTAALSTDNNGATIAGATPAFNDTCTNPTLPSN